MEINKSKMSYKQGFTLIELLVVVLIIGILAAVAVPQYQKAVEKARLAEALQVIASLQKAIDVYILTNGYPASDSDEVYVIGGDDGGLLDISMGLSLECSFPNEDPCVASTDWKYRAKCDIDGCFIMADRVENKYGLVAYKDADGNSWEHICETFFTSLGEGICNSLTGQGWEYWEGEW